MEYINKNPGLMKTIKDKAGNVLDTGIGAGQWALGAAGAAAKMPFQLLSKAANQFNPLNPQSRNYNPELQGQVDALNARNMLGDQSSPYKITSGPLAGKNLVSGFGTNDYDAMLSKKISWFEKRKAEKKSISDKAYQKTLQEQQRREAEKRQAATAAAAAAQVRSNIQRYGSGDRPDTGMNAPGGGRGQSPTGGNVQGTPFNTGGLVALWQR